VRTHRLPVNGDLRHDVSALVGSEATVVGSLPLTIAPHDAMVLAAQFVCDKQELYIKSGLGSNTRVTGIRQRTGRVSDSTGSWLALFALLTLLGAVQPMNSRRLDASPRIRAPLAHLLDLSLTRQLKARVVVAGDLPATLAGAAAEMGFAGQSHMNRVVRRHHRSRRRFTLPPPPPTLVGMRRRPRSA
jgi:hypothetical protein